MMKMTTLRFVTWPTGQTTVSAAERAMSKVSDFIVFNLYQYAHYVHVAS